ncbi:hypothetical protein AX17_004923 [Amanita inopinata Kibby_2008]|nr:hypothetical protein AX17_004923 [Amanita inopinata Kibby_2008]
MVPSYDLEAQNTPASPAPAYTPTTHCPTTSMGYSNMIDDFFGMPVTRESRHDLNRTSVVIPPTYAETLPAYTLRAEPVTLAICIFGFGKYPPDIQYVMPNRDLCHLHIVFPPFWILGVIILLSPLEAPELSSSSPAWLPEKSEEERQFILAEMRRVEVKWAKRCLWALLSLILLVVGIGLAVWSAGRR